MASCSWRTADGRLRERRRQLRVGQVTVEVTELVGSAERLVRDQPKRERRDVCATELFRAAAGSVGGPLRLLIIGARGVARARAARFRGALCCASLPSAALSVGTTLQPSGSIPSSRQAVSIARRAAASRMNTIARPRLGSLAPGIAGSGEAGRLRRPVLPSADVAPRWRTRQRPSSRSSMTSRSWFPSGTCNEPDAACVALEGGVVQSRRSFRHEPSRVRA